MILHRISEELAPIRHPRVVCATLAALAIIAGTLTNWRTTPGVAYPHLTSTITLAAGLIALAAIGPLPDRSRHRRIIVVAGGAILTSTYLMRAALLAEALLDGVHPLATAAYTVQMFEWIVFAYITYVAWAAIIIPWASPPPSS